LKKRTKNLYPLRVDLKWMKVFLLLFLQKKKILPCLPDPIPSLAAILY